MTYVDYKVYSQMRRAAPHAFSRRRVVQKQSVRLPDAASYLTDFSVGIAFSLEFSISGFILLFAIARTRLAGADGRAEGK